MHTSVCCFVQSSQTREFSNPDDCFLPEGQALKLLSPYRPLKLTNNTQPCSLIEASELEEEQVGLSLPRWV